MSNYTISLSPQQARIVAAALTLVYGATNQPQFTGNDTDEALYLRNAFTELPNAELDCPGCIHGFVQ